MDLSTTILTISRSKGRAARLLALSLSLLVLPAMAACGGDGEGTDGGDTTGTATSKAAPGSGMQGSQTMQEYQRLSKQLDSIRQQAMQDSALQAQQAELREAIQAKMEEDPQTQALVARFDSARKAFKEAQASGDSAAMKKLMPQLQQMQMQLQQAQGKVTQDSGIAAMIDSFRQDLQAEMKEINPRSPEMIERADSLVKKIRQDMSAGAKSGAAAPDTGEGGL